MILSFSPGCGGSEKGGDAGPDAGSDSGFDPTVYVNPFLGTGGSGPWGIGSAFPGATAPSGMVKLSPDTISENDDTVLHHCAGYFFQDEYINCFSQTHLYGTGAPDYANLGVIPALGRDIKKTTPEKYRLKYDKKTEAAVPGYYTVSLEGGIIAELAASERTGLHRFRFPASDTRDRCVIIDLGHSIPFTFVNSATLEIDKKSGAIKGSIKAVGIVTRVFNGYILYFSGSVTPAPQYAGRWDSRNIVSASSSSCSDSTCGAMFCFSGVDTVELRLGLSYVSTDNASENLKAETGGRTFDQVREETRGKWKSLLGAVKIVPDEALDPSVFYTAIYHDFMMPSVVSDSNGDYPGFDGQKHIADWGPFYSNISLWDTYRTQHPFFTLSYRRQQRDMVMSMLNMARQGGYFPKWPAIVGEGDNMIATPADVMVADSYLKGIDFPAPESFDLLMKTALHPTAPGSGYTGRDGIEDYLATGYLPSDRHKGSVSKTQEYAYSDNALCNMAQGLGRVPEAASLCNTRFSHRNLWNVKNSFFMARNSQGSFPNEDSFDPGKVITSTLFFPYDEYVEGDGWHYRWFAPHDVAWLIEQDGGAEKFVAKLMDYFEKSIVEEAGLTRGTEQWGWSRSYYWAGNEPGIFTPYMFSAAGRPDLACKYLRWIMRTYYLNRPDGLPGNDDAGTISSWLIFTALGIYPVPGTDTYYLGCPAVRSAELPAGDGMLKITAEGPMGDAARPARFFWNGTELLKPELSWQQLKSGGELRFVMEESTSSVYP
ncbi:MAG: GH92 family glycosyl hydrolase [Myxococcota bacterium]